MIHFEVKSEHDPTTWLKLWDRRIVKLDSKNKSAYSGEKCFFGTQDGHQLMVYFHSDYANNYMLTRFTGTIERDGKGSKITGEIGKMKTALMFLKFMVVMMGAGCVAMIVNQQYPQALLLLALAVLGLGLHIVTPADSVKRLERLLTVISTEDYDPDEDESYESDASADAVADSQSVNKHTVE